MLKVHRQAQLNTLSATHGGEIKKYFCSGCGVPLLLLDTWCDRCVRCSACQPYCAGCPSSSTVMVTTSTAPPPPPPPSALDAASFHRAMREEALVKPKAIAAPPSITLNAMDPSLVRTVGMGTRKQLSGVEFLRSPAQRFTLHCTPRIHLALHRRSPRAVCHGQEYQGRGRLRHDQGRRALPESGLRHVRAQ